MVPTITDTKRKIGEGSKAAAAGPLTAEELCQMDAYWRASNYLSVGQIYLLDNPLLKEPLKREHIKPRLLGHWGTAVRLWWPTPTWKAPTARCTRTSARMSRA